MYEDAVGRTLYDTVTLVLSNDVCPDDIIDCKSD